MADVLEIKPMLDEEAKHRAEAVQRIIETVLMCGDNPKVREYVAGELEFSFERGKGVGVLEGIDTMSASATRIVDEVFRKVGA